MRAARRALKFAVASILDDPYAADDYVKGGQIDALETLEARRRNEITKEEGAIGDPLVIEAYQTVEAHRNRIERATKTPIKAEIYESKLRCSIQRDENGSFQEIANVSYNERKQILITEIEQLEQETRHLIATEAMKRHSFFEIIRKKTNDALVSEAAGFHVD